jgi:hypothetical protein
VCVGPNFFFHIMDKIFLCQAVFLSLIHHGSNKGPIKTVSAEFKVPMLDAVLYAPNKSGATIQS